MDLIYTLAPPPAAGPSSIFLAGPAPRDGAPGSWRPAALGYLRARGYAGHVYVPETRDGSAAPYEDQVAWEEMALNRADVILFWVPRDMAKMPGLTTNDEWGTWKGSGKVVWGCPPAAPKTRYQLHHAKRLLVPVSSTLESTVESALNRLLQLGAPAPRTGAELEVPAHVWSTASFQSWYGNLKAAGNRLDGARVEYTFRVGPGRRFIFRWCLWARVWIAAEGRHKENEIVLGRPDVSTVVLHGPAKHPAQLRDVRVVLVREFRTPVNNDRGRVAEPPGGSSKVSGGARSALETAAEEVAEETGFHLDPTRLRYLGARQIAPTLSSHCSHLYAAELTEDEMDALELEADRGVPRGVEADTERTYLEVTTLEDLLGREDVGWESTGQILHAVYAHSLGMT